MAPTGDKARPSRLSACRAFDGTRGGLNHERSGSSLSPVWFTLFAEKSRNKNEAVSHRRNGPRLQKSAPSPPTGSIKSYREKCAPSEDRLNTAGCFIHTVEV